MKNFLKVLLTVSAFLCASVQMAGAAEKHFAAGEIKVVKAADKNESTDPTDPKSKWYGIKTRDLTKTTGSFIAYGDTVTQKGEKVKAKIEAIYNKTTNTFKGSYSSLNEKGQWIEDYSVAGRYTLKENKVVEISYQMRVVRPEEEKGKVISGVIQIAAQETKNS